MNPLAAAAALEDVQGQPDLRGVAIDEVGIANLRLPLRVAGRDGTVQPTVASVAATVALPEDARGTHMSRFVESLTQELAVVDADALHALAATLAERLASPRARVELRFPWFVERTAPVSGLSAPLDCDATLAVEGGVAAALSTGVRVPVTSLCPCSREISDYGAHNQRGYVEIEAHAGAGAALWLDELVAIAEAAASAPVHPLLKRVDERHVTMQAFDKPAFVEDIARDVALALRDDPRVHGFVVRVVNQESIHSHDAVATIRGGRAR